MTQFQQRPSGLAVPVPPPSRPPRQYGPLELHNKEQRAQAAKALNDLWDALDLSYPVGMLGPSREKWEAYYQAWRFIGTLLLANDCPGREILT